jgi:hypothetical protein
MFLQGGPVIEDFAALFEVAGENPRLGLLIHLGGRSTRRIGGQPFTLLSSRSFSQQSISKARPKEPRSH